MICIWKNCWNTAVHNDPVSVTFVWLSQKQPFPCSTLFCGHRAWLHENEWDKPHHICRCVWAVLGKLQLALHTGKHTHCQLTCCWLSGSTCAAAQWRCTPAAVEALEWPVTSSNYWLMTSAQQHFPWWKSFFKVFHMKDISLYIPLSAFDCSFKNL